MSNKRAVDGVRSNLRYMAEDVSMALVYAKEVKDPELVKKLESLKEQTKSTADYLTGRLDPKQG